MKNKKTIIILVILIIILGLIGYFVFNKLQEKKQEEITEFIPEEEINVTGLRQTVVSLYFNKKDTNTLMPEARRVDVKELIKAPYDTLMNLLLEGPKNEGLERAIPEGTKLNKIEFSNRSYTNRFIQGIYRKSHRRSRSRI